MTLPERPSQDDVVIGAAIASGREHAGRVLAAREEELALRRAAAAANPGAFGAMLDEAASGSRVPRRTIEKLGPKGTAGVLVAEGDSWFDYPFRDILDVLEDEHGFEVYSVAHRGDRIEDMAYSDGQLAKLLRRVDDVIRDGRVPRGILLSGGGNDIAGDELGMLLNHRASGLAAWNAEVLRGVVDERLLAAHAHIITATTSLCIDRLGRPVPIVVHGYDYPVPDGRGVAGGWGPLPGPWLEPSFRRKGFGDPQLDQRRRDLMVELMDHFNAMLRRLVAHPQFAAHVRYVDLRGTLRNDVAWERWWANELHPTRQGFSAVARRIRAVL